jgi:hypothetical protein
MIEQGDHVIYKNDLREPCVGRVAAFTQGGAAIVSDLYNDRQSYTRNVEELEKIEDYQEA